MSSDYILHETEQLKIDVIEQSMRYTLGLESKHLVVGALDDTDDKDLALDATGDADDDLRIRSVTMRHGMTADQFRDFIVECARVYSYQHAGSDSKPLRDALSKVLI